MGLIWKATSKVGQLVWPVVRFCIVWILGRGFIEFLATEGVYPDHWVATVLGLATNPNTLNWVAWGLAGLAAFGLSFPIEYVRSRGADRRTGSACREARAVQEEGGLARKRGVA